LPSVGFQPEFALPDPSPRLRDFFSVVDLPFHRLGRVGGKDLVLFDLMGNPGTRTTKTLASTVIVARAVRHIDRTGEPIVILTPSSANKATALRDAVLRAYRAGLAGPESLRIVTLVPDAARPKLWSSELTDDPALAALNPMCVLPPGHPDHVKTVALQALEMYSAEVYERTGARLWHTLDLANYRCADAVRAFVEQADLPRSGYFLVQHLDTADMVQSLHGISAPEYRLDQATGLYHQDEQPRYPATTFDPAENLETTFYTRKPATSPAMNQIIAAQGGGGIVVSLHECLAAYGRIRVLLGDSGITLPADPRSLREWSLVMVLTGVLNGIDRGLVDADEIVVHASGSYDTSDYTPIPDRSLHPVGGAADLRPAILATAGLRSPRRAA
jgi:hypothetical protein